MKQKKALLNFLIITSRSDFSMFKKLKYKKDFSKMNKCYENEDFKNAIFCADLILDYDEGNIEVLKCKYNSLTKLELYDDALECVNEILDLNPSGRALVNKGTTLCFLGNYDEGFEILDNVIVNCPEYEVAFLNKGNFLYNMGDFEELLKLSDWVLELYPDCSNAYDIKALVFIEQSDFKSALECIDKALEYNPNNENSKERKKFILDIIEKN